MSGAYAPAGARCEKRDNALCRGADKLAQLLFGRDVITRVPIYVERATASAGHGDGRTDEGGGVKEKRGSPKRDANECADEGMKRWSYR